MSIGSKHEILVGAQIAFIQPYYYYGCLTWLGSAVCCYFQWKVTRSAAINGVNYFFSQSSCFVSTSANTGGHGILQKEFIAK